MNKNGRRKKSEKKSEKKNRAERLFLELSTVTGVPAEASRILYPSVPWDGAHLMVYAGRPFIEGAAVGDFVEHRPHMGPQRIIVRLGKRWPAP